MLSKRSKSQEQIEKKLVKSFLIHPGKKPFLHVVTLLCVFTESKLSVCMFIDNSSDE